MKTAANLQQEINMQLQTIPPENRPDFKGKQAGGALLSAVAITGVALVLIQGTLFYQSRESTKFLGSEASKIVALQLAEAGVEANIADLGSRTLRVDQHSTDLVTYENQAFGTGSFTTTLTRLGGAADADTVDVVSRGIVRGKEQTVTARLRLRGVLDSSLTPIMKADPETTYTFNAKVVAETTITTVTKDPSTMPALDKTPAYEACVGSSSKKCEVCHLPGGDPTKAGVTDVAKSALDTHIDHHGDYVTTDGTCDIYKPKEEKTVTLRNRIDTLMVVDENITYDTVAVVDTTVKVQVLSWR
jgi:hypothetical protein